MGLEAPKDSRMDQNVNLEGIQEAVSDLKNEIEHSDEAEDNSKVDNSKVDNSSEVDNSKETENSSEAESSNYIESNIYNKNNMKKAVYKESRFGVSGRVAIGDIVFGDKVTKGSDHPGYVASLTLQDKKTGLAFSGIRASNLRKGSPDDPTGRATVLVPNRNYSFGKNKDIHVGAGVEYAMLDNFPEGNGFTPFASCSYDINKGKNNIGLTFFHEQKNDSLRLSFQQKIFGALDILAQGWYDTNYDKHFSGAITLNANLGQGFGLQANCKRERDGKIVLTSGVIYQFSK